MNIFALVFGSLIGLLAWSRLVRLAYAIHDSSSKQSLATKLSNPNSGALTKLIRYLAAASLIWVAIFIAACVHFSNASPSKYIFAWFFGGVSATPFFIASTTVRTLRKLNKQLASSSK